MCCCEKPNINGTPGYKWSPDDTPTTRPVNPPAVPEGMTVLYDEPGRCGIGCDSHCHHLILAKGAWEYVLLVRHGGGDVRLPIRRFFPIEILAKMTSDERYRMFISIYYGHMDTVRAAVEAESTKWRKAILEKRISTNRRTGRVSITPPQGPQKST